MSLRRDNEHFPLKSIMPSLQPSLYSVLRLSNISIIFLSLFGKLGACETLCEMELFEHFKQSAQALELLHERKMWNEQKPHCLSEARKAFFANAFPHLE